MDIKIDFCSNDMYGDTIRACYNTIKKETMFGGCYVYNDGISDTSIEYSNDKIVLKRIGEINGTLILNKNLRGEFEYKAPYLSKIFETKCLLMSVKKDGLDFIYEIYDEGELINKIEINIREGG